MNNLSALLLLPSCLLFAAEPVGTLSTFVGSAEVSTARAPGWKAARTGVKLFANDQLRTGEESSAEIRWANGGILRVAEQSAIAIAGPTDAEPRSSGATVLSGKVWANMKKITSTGTEFGISTPTATAAIRGTVFRVDMAADSATDVLVYQGKVAVKPVDTGATDSTGTPEGRHEVKGPSEVEGPREVTLEEWITIVAGQQIRVERTGAHSTWQFDRKKDRQDAWVAYNLKEDARLGKK
ncbi:MAG: FecR domain-containing protein [Chitinispirillaceae bacterium]|nr:FecR domain-containing protein [Chitinispirillaceae bacterium]